MKINSLRLLFVAFFIITYASTSQEITSPELSTAIIQQYEKDTKFIRKDGTIKQLDFNKKMLNILFTKEISNYLTESSNLNVRKAFAVLTEEDDRLFLGGSFTNPFKKRKPINRLIGLNTLGIKADIKDKFASVFSSGDLNNDLGISYKYTYIGRGRIKYNSKKNADSQAKFDKEKVASYRKEYLLDEFLDEQVQASLKSVLQSNTKKEVINELNGKPKSKLLNVVSESSFNELYKKVLEEESNNMIKQKWYTNYYNWWLSFETFLPISKTEYKISENIGSNKINTSSYRPYEVKFSGNLFVKTASYGSFQFRGILEGYCMSSNKVELFC